MSEAPSNLVKLIEGRMEELGLPRDCMFHQGRLTDLFLHDGLVMVTCGGKRTGFYRSGEKWSQVMNRLADRCSGNS